MTHLSIIIPHLDAEPALRRCLDALAPQLDFNCEVIVVDNGSRVLPTWVSDYPVTALLTASRKGAAYARNRGVAASEGRRLAFLDADCVPGPDWVEIACESTAPILGGQVELFQDGQGRLSGAECFEAAFAFRNDHYVCRKGFSVTANMVVSRSVMEAVGPFRGGVSEDVDWAQRAARLRYRTEFEPRLKAGHPMRSDWQALKAKWRRVTDESYALHLQNGRSPAAWLQRAVLVLASPLKDYAAVCSSGRLCGPVQRLKCAATLTRLRLLRAGWMLRQVARVRPDHPATA